MTTQELSEIKAWADASTKKWRYMRPAGNDDYVGRALTDIPRLLEYVEELRAALKRLLRERAERGGRQHSSTCVDGNCRYCVARAALGDAP